MPVHREVRTSATESKYSSAVVKSGKLYVVQAQIGLCSMAASLSRRVGRSRSGVTLILDEWHFTTGPGLYLLSVFLKFRDFIEKVDRESRGRIIGKSKGHILGEGYMETWNLETPRLTQD